MAETQIRRLHKLAHLYGVQASYYDAAHRRRSASPRSLLLILKALDVSVETLSDVSAAAKKRQQALWSRCVEPIVVAWNGGPADSELRLPRDAAYGRVTCRLRFESGGVRRWSFDLTQLPTLRTEEIGLNRYTAKRLTIAGGIPLGYHKLTLETRDTVLKSTVVSAPAEAYSAPIDSGSWGVFTPLYALHSERSWGGGDFTDLETLAAWVAELGGNVVATLPFLSSFLDQPFDPSPYAPVSRLFWNEFYIDINRVPELERCSKARNIVKSRRFQRELKELHSSPLVDYLRQTRLKRRVLEELTRIFFTETSERRDAFHRFVKSNPELEEYARFRAACERQRAPWPKWPPRLRSGDLQPQDYSEEAVRYHLYVQWLAYEQIRSLAEKVHVAGQTLYLDFPLGVHPYSYDVWRERDLFVQGVSVGAPPDAVFTGGQNWVFPPLHPEKIREEGYRYYVSCLRSHMSLSSLLRIDHVMGLHRLFWIPKGLKPVDGVYVRYPSEELYAILCLESHRHRCRIVGENLGTVPRYVNTTLARHKIHRMYVAQYELTSNLRRALRTIPTDSVASLNTHDMPPFTAFWQNCDIEERLSLGFLDEVDAEAERRHRRILKRALTNFLRVKNHLKEPATPSTLLKACLTYLSVTPAPIVIINLEDLWFETQPQNVPGTLNERLNWRRKTRYSLEEFRLTPQVLNTLRQVDLLRRRSNQRIRR